MNEQCLDVNQMAAYVDGNISDDQRPLIEEHLAQCPKCREIVVFGFRMKEKFPDSNPTKPSTE